MLKKIVRLINNIFAVRGHCIKCTHTALLVLIKREWKRERERERKSATEKEEEKGELKKE